MTLSVQQSPDGYVLLSMGTGAAGIGMKLENPDAIEKVIGMLREVQRRTWPGYRRTS